MELATRVKITDLIVCRKKMIGIVIKIDDEDLDSDGIVWAQIMWADGKITWEDIHTTLEDPLFYILNTDA